MTADERDAEAQRLMAILQGTSQPVLFTETGELQGQGVKYWFSVEGDTHFNHFARSRRAWADCSVIYVPQPDGSTSRCLSTEGVVYYVRWLLDQGIITSATYQRLCDYLDARQDEERQHISLRFEVFQDLKLKMLT